MTEWRARDMRVGEMMVLVLLLACRDVVRRTRKRTLEVTLDRG